MICIDMETKQWKELAITNPEQEVIHLPSKRRRKVSASSPRNDSQRAPAITIDTDVDRPKTIGGGSTTSPPKLVSPQYDNDKSLPPLEGMRPTAGGKETSDSDRDDQGTDQTGLATLSTAASLMSKQ